MVALGTPVDDVSGINDNHAMKRLAVSLVSSLVLTLFLLPLLFVPAHAQEESWAVPSVTDVADAIQETVDGVIHKEGSETQSQVVMEAVLGCQILGCSDDPDHPIGYNKSVVASVGKGIAFLYENPPASTYAFAVDLGKTMGFLPRVYAQGVGFSGLGNLIDIWKIFRNIAYGIIAIIMVIIGFMVMLRKKIDPKTVVTVQNAIPRVVIALLLVTFSYAIVGFMIDLMYVSMLLIANVLINVNPGAFSVTAFGFDVAKFLPDWVNAQPFVPITPTSLVTSNFLTILSAFFVGGWYSLKGIFALVPLGWGVGISAFSGLVGLVFGKFSLKSAALGAAAPAALPVLIVGLAVLIGVVRLFFLLLDAYIHIIIALLTSPFHLMLEAIPGTNTFGSWFRNLLGKLLVFPVVITLTLVTYLLTSGITTGAVWAPPLLWGNTAGEGLGGLIGLGMLLSLPSIVGGIQKALKGEPLVPAGIGTIVGPLGSGISQLMNLYYQTTMIRAYSRKDHAPSPYQQGAAAAGQSPTSILTGGGGQK